MAYIGDLVPKAGNYTNPGVVIKKNEDGTVEIDTEPMVIHKYHRFTNTTGLTENEKNTFNTILDDIYQNHESDVSKINEIQMKIDKMQVDPKNSTLVQYLRNQQAHLIRKTRELPRTYNIDESKLRLNQSRLQATNSNG